MDAPFPCDKTPSTCETNPNPLTAFSSEADDSTTFIGIAWQNKLPALNKPFTVYPCEAIVESQVSQADADRIADNQTVICASPCDPIFSNSVQTASGVCANGSIYSVTIPAGIFVADNQVLADRKAFTAAAAALRGRSICMGTLVPTATLCRGDFYFGTIAILSTDTPVTVDLIAGDLPPGISMTIQSDRIVLQGTATTFGTHQFTLRATSAAGLVTQQNYLASVTGIVTDSALPDAFFGTPYSVTLTAFNPNNAAEVWSITSGTLPSGLSLDSATGIISGTPSSGGGLLHLTIECSINGGNCSKAFTMNAQIINWSQLVWTNVLATPGSGPSPVAIGVFSGANFNVAAKGTGGPPSKVEALGTLTFTGPAVNCKVTVTVTAAAINGGFSVVQDGVHRLDVVPANLPAPGVYVLPFSLIAGVNSVVLLTGRLDVGDPARLWAYGTTGVLEAFSGTFSNA
jgi:hypothetical protein